VNVSNENGETPLDLARQWGHEETLALLEARLRARLHEAQQSEFDALMEMGR